MESTKGRKTKISMLNLLREREYQSKPRCCPGGRLIDSNDKKARPFHHLDYHNDTNVSIFYIISLFTGYSFFDTS